jgi:hypothetical protein
VTIPTTARHHRTSWRSAATNRAFIVHYLQMLAAILAGMVVLGPLSMLLGDGASAEVQALLMATWLGQLSTDGLILVGHVLMLPAMAIAMLRRREEDLPAH